MSGEGARDPRAGAVAARVGGGLGLLVATFYVLRPFLVPVVWAGILAYVTWPLYRKVSHVTKRPRVAAGLFTATVALGVGIPVAWMLVALASEATHLIGLAREWVDAAAPFPEWVTSRPWLSERLARIRDESVIEPAERAAVVEPRG